MRRMDGSDSSFGYRIEEEPKHGHRESLRSRSCLHKAANLTRISTSHSLLALLAMLIIFAAPVLPICNGVAFAEAGEATTYDTQDAVQNDTSLKNAQNDEASFGQDDGDDSESKVSHDKNASSIPNPTAAKGKLVDASRKGSIKVRLSLDGNPVSKASIKLNKIAGLEWNTGTSEWSWVPEKGFKGIDMESLGANSEEELSKVLTQASSSNKNSNNKIQSATKKSNEKGEVSFGDLDLGLYVLSMVEKEDPEGLELSPFCVSLPSDEGDSYVYDIDATPKLALAKTMSPIEDTGARQASPLPKTGDEITFLVVFVLLLTMAVSIGVWMVSWLAERKRLKHQLKNLSSDDLMLRIDRSSSEEALENLASDRSAFIRRLALALCAFSLIAGVFLLLAPKEAFAVERVDIDISNGVASATAFKLGVNQSPTLEMNNGTTKADFDNGNRREITAKIPDSKGAWTVSNPVKLTYNNAGTINKRKVKVVVSIDSVRFKKGGKDTNNGFKHGTYVTIAHMTGSSLFIGCRSKDYTYGMSNNNGYTIKTSITFTWADTGEVINLPFIQGVYDIDQYDSSEAWEAVSGFSKYLVYKGTNLSQSGNKFYLPKDYGSLNDDASKYKGGLYATTHSGSFQSTFYGANCDSQLVLYNQLMQLSPPVKSVNNPTPKPGEEIEWTVDQKIGTYIKDSFTGYSSLRFSDTLDERLEYVSSAMFEGSSDITKTAGSLTFDESSRRITFDFNQSWLSTMSNYKGQTLRLKIKTKIKKETYGQTIPNKAIVSNSNVNFEVDSKVDVPSYKATGSWAPQALKKLDGNKLKEGQFTFRLLSSDGSILNEVKNKADGEITFDPISYTQDDDGKTLKYRIVEVTGDEPGMTYDTTSHDVEVKIVDNKDETLTITPTYEGGDIPEFVNYALTYSDAPYPTTGGSGIAFAALGAVLVLGGLFLRKIRK